jgi:integrase
VKPTPKGPLAISIDQYLAHKRSLGKDLVKVGSMLYLLDDFLLVRGVPSATQITHTHLEGFIASRPRRTPRSYSGLVGAIRGLLDWMVAHEILTESPLLCEKRRITPSPRPFLFSLDQAHRVLEIASQLPSNPRAQNRGEIYRMIFALLYALGLRVGEVSRLCRKDIDFDRQVLVIRQTKFGKDRLVPFGPKVGHAVAEYLKREESRVGTISPEGAVFSFDRRERRRISTNTISWTFHKILPALQLEIPSGTAPPHLHCLRHSFAVSTLLRWYRTGSDPMSRLFDLSTFMGHVSPSSTAVYLTITTELLECAGERFAMFAETSRKESAR